MQIVYWAHSYRDEDAAINRHFGVLIEQAGRMIVNFDPPSESVNEAKLLQNLRSCDGMVAVLTWRANGPSAYILYEIGLALRARKPLLVYVDERIGGDVLPRRVLQLRFSHRTFFRQVREQVHVLNSLKAYMGDPPPERYQPPTDQRSCGVLGLSALSGPARAAVAKFVEVRGYRAVDLEKVAVNNPLSFLQFEHLAVLGIVLHCADRRSVASSYWSGALAASTVPSIAFTGNADFQFSDRFPREFQPRRVESEDAGAMGQVLDKEFDLFEQNFLNVNDADSIERYVKMQIKAGELKGNYEADTRQVFIGAVMGDQYNVSGQTGAVGPNAHAHDMQFTQQWQSMQGRIDLDRLADELARLRTAMEAAAVAPAEKLAVGAVAAAEESARQKDGPKVVEYLKTAGKWAFSVAEKIGVDLAKEAIKGTLGI